MKVISLTISLNDWSPKIWRRIWVKDNTRLDKLCEVLYTSMGWSGEHLSEIQTKHGCYGDKNNEFTEDLFDWKKFTLADILKTKITQFKFNYDFGDGWEMTVKIKEEPKLIEDAHYPVCVNGKNAAPPEDVGSYAGYEHFIKVMKNPKHPEFKELSDWWGDDSFDPAHFSVDEVNTVLEEI